MAEAAGGEVFVSETVKDIIAGSALRFEDRGTYGLKGIEGPRRLFAVARPAD
jgi:class 3 adenylate cyclase